MATLKTKPPDEADDRMRRRWARWGPALRLSASLLASIGTPSYLAGQGKVEFSPFVAFYLATSDVIAVSDVFTPGDDLTAKQKPAVMLGSRVALRVTDAVAVEASFGYAPSNVRGAYTPPGGPAETMDVDATLLLLSGRVLIGLGPRAGSNAWHLILGGGAILHGGDAYGNGEGTTDIGGVVGVGGRFTLGTSSLAIRVDVEDNLFSAKFRDTGSGLESESKFQNDIVISMGLVIPFGSR